MARAPSPAQLDLLAWSPPETVRAFDPAAVRAGTWPARIAKAVGAVLRDCPLDRAKVAQEMSAYLGARVSVNVLNAWASEARDEHTIPLTRLIALLAATRDRRLLELFAAEMGWAVIERRHLPLIDLAAVQEQQDTLRRQADRLRYQARQGGAL